MSKRQRPKVGDIFEIPLGDGRLGVGHVLSRDVRMLFYTAVFGGIYESAAEVPIPGVAKEPIVCLAGCTLEGVELGVWRRLGRVEPDLQHIPLPAFLVAIGQADNMFVESWGGTRRRSATPVERAVVPHRVTHSSGVLLAAVRAIAGERPWDERLESIRLGTLREQAALCQV